MVAVVYVTGCILLCSWYRGHWQALNRIYNRHMLQ